MKPSTILHTIIFLWMASYLYRHQGADNLIYPFLIMITSALAAIAGAHLNPKTNPED